MKERLLRAFCKIREHRKITFMLLIIIMFFCGFSVWEMLDERDLIGAKIHENVAYNEKQESLLANVQNITDADVKGDIDDIKQTENISNQEKQVSKAEAVKTDSKKVISPNKQEEEKFTEQQTVNNNVKSDTSNLPGDYSVSSDSFKEQKIEQKEEQLEQPVKEQKWIVDQEAWEETVTEPINEMQEVSVGNQSGLIITGDPNEYLLNNLNGDTGWHSEWREVQTGTNTYTVPHDEIGHWE